jgi:hypothetical protein
VHGNAHGHAHGGALGIGLLHGVAGSSHLYGVLPALALGAGERVSYLVAFGIGSIVAMGTFAGLLALLLGRLSGSRERVRRQALVGASVIAIVIGLAWMLGAAM